MLHFYPVLAAFYACTVNLCFIADSSQIPRRPLVLPHALLKLNVFDDNPLEQNTLI